MARSGLSQRLGRIREQQKKIPSDEPVSGDASTVTALAGWKRSAPFLFERISSLPVNTVTLSNHFPLLFPRERSFLESIPDISEQLSSFVFFDLETTGLSHGAGTVAFMAGLAQYTGSGQTLEIHQLLLADYPGEADFLARFADFIAPDSILVSFNGKSFDSQILFNRFSMNGIRSPLLTYSPVHLDLLYPSRRIWKERIGSCRLQALEKEILGILREDDLPGSEAPEAWFSWVKTGETEKLLAVGDHNRDDCRSLPLLLSALDRAIDTGESRASLIRALDLRNAASYREARKFLEPLATSGDRIALRILAIDAEHRLGDLDCALECARVLGDLKRIDRIERKQAALRSAGGEKPA